MIPRIKSVSEQEGYMLKVLFEDGKKVLYNVADDIENIESFKDLKNIQGLWKQYNIDQSRTCVYWNDYIDLASDSIYEYGTEI